MSGGMGELKDAVVAYLERDRRFQGAKLIKEFPASARPGVLREPMIVSGFSNVEVIPGGFGGYYGEKSGADGGGLYGKTARVTMYFDIHCPPEQGGDACHRLYEALCDALVLENATFGFLRIWCDSISGDKSSFSNRLRVYGLLQGAVTSLETGAPMEIVVIKN